MEGDDETVAKAGVLRYVPSCLATLGVKPESFLRQFGLTLSDIPLSRALLPYAQLARIYSEAASATRCPNFGILAGLSGGLHTAESSRMQTATNARQALEFHCEQRSAYNSAAQLFVASSGRSTSVRYVITDANVESGDQISESALAIIYKLLQATCGPSWKPDSVSLARAQPDDTHYLNDLFDAPLLFDAACASIEFPTMWLGKSIGLHAGHQLVQSPDNLLDATVSSYCKRMLDGDVAGSALIAHDLGMSRRTFHRRLADAGVSYQGLIDQTRFGVARRLLRDTDMSVTDMSFMLGYSETAAFTRAFSHWHGHPPSHLRREAMRG